MTNEELCAMIQDGHNEYMAELYEQNVGLIRKCAWQFSHYAEAEMDDLVQEAYFGLLKAAEQYRQDKGSSFASYAWQWISATLQRYTGRNGMSVSEHTAVLIRKMNRISSEYQAVHGREPDETELRLLLNLNRQEWESLKRAKQALNPVSIETPLQGDDTLTVGDTIEDPRDDYEDVVERIHNEQLAEVLWPLVDDLEEQQRRVIRERYQQNGTHTLQAVAEKTGLPASQVRTAHDHALKELRSYRNKKRLQPYLDDERAYSWGLHGTGLQRFRDTWTSSVERVILRAEEKEKNRG